MDLIGGRRTRYVKRTRNRGRWKMVEAPQKKKNVVRDASQKRQRDEERGTELFPRNLRRRCIR